MAAVFLVVALGACKHSLRGVRTATLDYDGCSVPGCGLGGMQAQPQRCQNSHIGLQWLQCSWLWPWGHASTASEVSEQPHWTTMAAVFLVVALGACKHSLRGVR